MSETILGLELSDHSIRAVQVRRISFKKFVIERAAREKVEVSSAEERAQLIKEFIEKNALDSDHIVASFPGKRVFFRSTVLPFSDVKKIARTIKYEFEPTLPVPVEELVAGFVLDEAEDAKTKVFGALVFKDELGELISMLQEADVEPEIITLGSMALASIVPFKNTAVESPKLVIKLDYDSSEVVLVENGKGKAVRNFPVGTRSIVKDDGLGTNEEALKNRWYPELSRSIEIFEERYSAPRFQGIFLSGDICDHYELLKYVEAFLVEEMKVPCEPLITPEDPAIAGLSEVLGRERDKYSVAIGLALAGLVRNDILNLRQDEFAVQLRFKTIKRDLINVGIGFAIVMILFLGNLFFQVHTDRKVYDYWNTKLAQDFRSVFPKGTKMVKPVSQMETRVSEATKMVEFFAGEDFKMSALDILKVIHKSIPPDMKVALTNLSIDPATLRISGQTDSYNTVDRIKSLLEKSGYFSSIKITNAKVNRSRKGVSFKMMIERAK